MIFCLDFIFLNYFSFLGLFAMKHVWVWVCVHFKYIRLRRLVNCVVNFGWEKTDIFQAKDMKPLCTPTCVDCDVSPAFVRPAHDISLEEFDDEDLSEITDDCGIGLNYDSDPYEKVRLPCFKSLLWASYVVIQEGFFHRHMHKI